MPHRRVVVIGAGPAGTSFAYLAGRMGYEVEVYEAARKPGVKPCAWATPRSVTRYVEVPDELVLNVIESVDVYLDGALVHSVELGANNIYIIDKPRWLSFLLEKSGSRIFLGKKANEEGAFGEGVTVIATGNKWERSPRPRLRALEYVVKTGGWLSDKLELWFNSSFVGYTWIFPQGEGKVTVGVGAFKSYQFLKEYLDSFVARHGKLCGGRVLRMAGDLVVADGLHLELAEPRKGVYVVGEALGAVFPMTGEGIRPSVITSYTLLKALTGGGSYPEELARTGLLLAMKVQKVVVGLALALGPEGRAELLRRVPPEKAGLLALGEFNEETLRKELGELGEALESLDVNLEEALSDVGSKQDDYSAPGRYVNRELKGTAIHELYRYGVGHPE